MWNLEYELYLVILIAAVIGWFMGRSICKSKEYEIRSSVKTLKQENKRLNKELTSKESLYNETAKHLENNESQLTEIKYKYNTSKTLLATVTDEQTDALNQLQTLKPYQPRFEQLDKDYSEQSQKLAKLKVDLNTYKEDLEAVTAVSDKRKLKLLEYEQDLTQQEKELSSQKQLNKDKSQKLDELNEVRLDNSQLLEKVERLSENLDVSTSQCNKQVEDLEKFSSIEVQSQKLNASLNQLEQEKSILQTAHEKSLSQLEQKNSELQTTCSGQENELEALSNMQVERQKLQQASQVLQSQLEELEAELVNSHQEADSLSNKHNDLQSQHDQLLKDISPNKEYIQQLKKEISDLMADNNNLVSRLRAISSVVGAVGTDNEDIDDLS